MNDTGQENILIVQSEYTLANHPGQDGDRSGMHPQCLPGKSLIFTFIVIQVANGFYSHQVPQIFHADKDHSLGYGIHLVGQSEKRAVDQLE